MTSGAYPHISLQHWCNIVLVTFGGACQSDIHWSVSTCVHQRFSVLWQRLLKWHSLNCVNIYTPICFCYLTKPDKLTFTEERTRWFDFDLVDAIVTVVIATKGLRQNKCVGWGSEQQKAVLLYNGATVSINTVPYKRITRCHINQNWPLLLITAHILMLYPCLVLSKMYVQLMSLSLHLFSSSFSCFQLSAI